MGADRLKWFDKKLWDDKIPLAQGETA